MLQTLLTNTISVITPRRTKGREVWHVCGRSEIHIGFCWENLKEMGSLEILMSRWQPDTKMYVKE
jgi:hypothetical protein